MVKVVILFYQPDNPQALENFYYQQYLPLAIKIPGLIRVEVTKYYSDIKKVFMKKDNTTPVYQLMSELYFEDVQSFEEAFKTPIGETLANSSIQVAWDLMTVMLGDVTSITPEEYEKNPTFIRRVHK